MGLLSFPKFKFLVLISTVLILIPFQNCTPSNMLMNPIGSDQSAVKVGSSTDPAPPSPVDPPADKGGDNPGTDAKDQSECYMINVDQTPGAKNVTMVMSAYASGGLQPMDAGALRIYTSGGSEYYLYYGTKLVDQKGTFMLTVPASAFAIENLKVQITNEQSKFYYIKLCDYSSY